MQLSPVPVNEKIIIKHLKTGQNLSLEPMLLSLLQLSTHTYIYRVSRIYSKYRKAYFKFNLNINY